MQDSERLRQQYTFFDFLFYTGLLAVPIITAALAIGRHSLWGLLAFAALAVGAVGLVLKLFCSRCPHYTRNTKLLRCIFFWNLPKFFPPRPGRLDAIDKVAIWAAPAVLLCFPLIWLYREPGLLVVYGLSLAVFLAAVRRHECHRCIYAACPLNKAPAEIPGGQ